MTDNKLNELLIAGEPEEKLNRKKEFKPVFNVREEFALWIREQFPELRKYSKKNKIYEELESRKKEVYEAALGAVNHGVVSTEACATARLKSGWYAFEQGFKENANPKKRAKSLEKFVEALEDLSISLGGNKHFTECGQFLNGGAYHGNLNAFVYRVGDEYGKDTKYLVFDKKQESLEKGCVLIGELTQLSEWDVNKLKKIALKFKGPETKFIEKVDADVFFEGVSYLGYRRGYSGDDEVSYVYTPSSFTRHSNRTFTPYALRGGYQTKSSGGKKDLPKQRELFE